MASALTNMPARPACSPDSRPRSPQIINLGDVTRCAGPEDDDCMISSHRPPDGLSQIVDVVTGKAAATDAECGMTTVVDPAAEKFTRLINNADNSNHWVDRSCDPSYVRIAFARMGALRSMLSTA